MASPATNEVKLPRAVLRRSAAIEQRIAELKAGATPPETPPVVTDPQAPTAETPPPIENPVPPAPPADPRESDPAYWKQRFQTADGIARRQASEHKAATVGLNQQVTELQEQVRTLQAAQPVAPTELSKVFSPEDVEKYGEAQCRAMLTAAEAAADGRFQKLVEAEIKPLKDAAKQRETDATKQQTDEAEAAKTRFRVDLALAYPKFAEVDVSPGWLAWLDDLDESSGLPRGQILHAHVRNGNVAATARMFKTYEALTAPPAPPVAPHGGAGDGGGLPSSAAPTIAGGAPTDAEVREFYKRSALNKVTREERLAFEARMKLRHPQAA